MAPKAVFVGVIPALLSFTLLGGCASLSFKELTQDPNLYRSGAIISVDVPFFPQQLHQCGPASLAMMLRWAGVDTDPDSVLPLVYVPAKQGSFQLELVTAVRHYNRIPYILSPDYVSVINELRAGNPILVFQNLGLDWYPRWHYAVLKGVDLEQNEVILHSGTREDYRVSLHTFENTWRRTKHWAMLVLPADRLPVSAIPLQYLKEISVLERLGKKALALQAYKAASQRWPADVTVNMALANLYYNQHDYLAARRLYQRIVELNPVYAPAYNNLAQTYLDSGDYQQALSHAETALRLGGRFNSQYRETLLSIQQKLGNKK